MAKFGINTIFTSRDKITTEEAKELILAGSSVEMVMPLKLQQPDGSWWLFPIEPLVSISGKNVVVKRNVAKFNGRGTVKERWAQDDFTINIQGRFVHADFKTYPKNDIETLKNIIAQKKEIGVQNALLAMLDINKIVIESYSFPFSKGENVQNFTIEASSDDVYDLFIEVNNV
jgi:hypothetical protein